MHGIIYKITNLVNNKIYIGQTTQSLQKRFNQHCTKALLKESKKECLHLPLQLAIVKYGRENFKIEQIDCAENQDELNSKEIYWINFYNSTNNKIGYNIASGGNNGGTTEKYRWYNDGINNYYINIDEVPYTKLTPGRIMSYPDNSNTVWINKGNEQKHVKVTDLDNYPDWNLGMLDRGDGWRAKKTHTCSTQTKQKISAKNKAWYQEHPDFRNAGNWKPGQIPHNKGKIWITNGSSNKYIMLDQLTDYIGLGWRRGCTQKPKTKGESE